MTETSIFVCAQGQISQAGLPVDTCVVDGHWIAFTEVWHKLRRQGRDVPDGAVVAFE
jgi:hypothetical protein